MGQGEGHPDILDGSRKLADAPAVMQNTLRGKSEGFSRKILIYVFSEHLHVAWQSSKEYGL